WLRQVLAIGYNDLVASCQLPVASQSQLTTDNWQLATDSLRVNNLTQTALAEASLRLAVEIALESLGVQSPNANQQLATDNWQLATALPFAILALGRLGHAGMDY